MKLLGVVRLAAILLIKNKEGGVIEAVKAEGTNETAPRQSASDNIILQT